ncbi:MAG: hypothetical protein GY742_18645 [Hyphomicrobiales bacterium]|nr:hypothetical protein [Hyphomicrobiales bacterium]
MTPIFLNIYPLLNKNLLRLAGQDGKRCAGWFFLSCDTARFTFDDWHPMPHPAPKRFLYAAGRDTASCAKFHQHSGDPYLSRQGAKPIAMTMLPAHKTKDTHKIPSFVAQQE